MLILGRDGVVRGNMGAAKQLSIAEIDQMINNLENAMTYEAVLGGDSSETKLEKEESLVHLKIDAVVWQNLLAYCEKNDLDPDQQIREALASYYIDLLKIYRMRARHSQEEELR